MGLERMRYSVRHSNSFWSIWPATKTMHRSQKTSIMDMPKSKTRRSDCPMDKAPRATQNTIIKAQNSIPTERNLLLTSSRNVFPAMFDMAILDMLNYSEVRIDQTKCGYHRTSSDACMDFFHSSFTVPKVKNPEPHATKTEPLLAKTVPGRCVSELVGTISEYEQSSMRKRFPQKNVYAPGHGVYPCHNRYKSRALLEKSRFPSSLDIFLQYVARSWSCGTSEISQRKCDCIVSVRIFPEISENRSNKLPAVSPSRRGKRSMRNDSPSSIHSDMRMIVTPVSFSPWRRHACMGDAHRYLGKIEACTFTGSIRGSSNTEFGSILPYATTMK